MNRNKAPEGETTIPLSLIRGINQHCNRNDGDWLLYARVVRGRLLTGNATSTSA